LAITAMLTWSSSTLLIAGDISGHAYRKDGKTPVKGVAVTLLHGMDPVDQQNTGSDGSYKVKFTDPGDYKLEFKLIPQRCFAPFVVEKELAKDAAKKEDVFVYLKDEVISADELFNIIKSRVSAGDDPSKGFDDLVAVSTIGVSPETLVSVGRRLTAEQPFAVSPEVGEVRSIDTSNEALLLNGESSVTPVQYKTSPDAIFINSAGKKISKEKAKEDFGGKKTTVISAKEGPSWVVKSVIESK
jgi:hypothetical protein